MKAAVFTGYGGLDRIEMAEVDDPKLAPGKVILGVRAAALNPLDWKIRRGLLKLVWRIRFPYVPGFDVAGEIAAAGPGSSWKIGDRVFSGTRGGGLAERVAIDERSVARIPNGVSFEEAAAIPVAAITALQAFRDSCRLRPGMRVLVHGGAGGVGTYAVQIARSMGAKVDATASARNLEMLRELGAERAIDYAREDFARERNRWDVILDAVAKRTFRECRGALAPGGVYCTTMPGPGPLFDIAATRLAPFAFGGRRASWIMLRPNRRDLETIAAWVEEGKVRSILDRVVPFRIDDIRAASEHLESGRARGKIVVRVGVD